MSLNRIVALLTPFAATAAGAAAVWLGDELGVRVDAGELQQLFIAGALLVVVPAAQWLHGWQKFEARQSDLERDLVLANATVPVAAAGAAVDPWEWEEGDEVEADDELSALEELEELAGIDELDDDLLDDEAPATAEV
jgi:hypothetical protein